MNRLFKPTLIAAALAACTSPAISYAATDTTQPNILVIIMDDLGTGQLDFDLESIDAKKLAQRPQSLRYKGDINQLMDAAKKAMPNVAELADTGVRMTNAYVPSPVCSASRAGILTGRNAESFGNYTNEDAGHAAVPLEVKFLPELLKDNGYTTAFIGAYDSGKTTTARVGVHQRTRDYHDNAVKTPVAGHSPLDRGFTHSYAYFTSGAALYDSKSIFRNHENVVSPGYTTHNFTQETINIIEASHKNNKPFFIDLSFSAPHIPLDDVAPRVYMEKFDTGNHEADKYYAHLNAADDGIGRIVAKLKELGMYDDTLILFLSDNGAVHESPMPVNGMDRGFKGQRYQGGVRIPFIAHWNGVIKPSENNDTMISALDILPTALSVANISIPDALNVTGKNILPVLKGEEDKAHDYLYFAGSRLMHFGEENSTFWNDYWKFITYSSDVYPTNHHSESVSLPEWAIRDQQWALQFHDGKFELYNYKNDPEQEHNVLANNPEKVKELKSEFGRWIKQQPQPNKWAKTNHDIILNSVK
ncbi:sulfatase-like hydrolase/transferase [Photobacterium japonica]|uniref:sulfatase family protein n=1 Tax=Photobacterium japonica TaxID=2910235 RepID=UPI003D0BF591